MATIQAESNCRVEKVEADLVNKTKAYQEDLRRMENEVEAKNLSLVKLKRRKIGYENGHGGRATATANLVLDSEYAGERTLTSSHVRSRNDITPSISNARVLVNAAVQTSHNTYTDTNSSNERPLLSDHLEGIPVDSGGRRDAPQSKNYSDQGGRHTSLGNTTPRLEAIKKQSKSRDIEVAIHLLQHCNHTISIEWRSEKTVPPLSKVESKEKRDLPFTKKVGQMHLPEDIVSSSFERKDSFIKQQLEFDQDLERIRCVLMGVATRRASLSNQTDGSGVEYITRKLLLLFLSKFDQEREFVNSRTELKDCNEKGESSASDAPNLSHSWLSVWKIILILQELCIVSSEARSQVRQWMCSSNVQLKKSGKASDKRSITSSILRRVCSLSSRQHEILSLAENKLRIAVMKDVSEENLDHQEKSYISMNFIKKLFMLIMGKIEGIDKEDTEIILSIQCDCVVLFQTLAHDSCSYCDVQMVAEGDRKVWDVLFDHFVFGRNAGPKNSYDDDIISILERHSSQYYHRSDSIQGEDEHNTKLECRKLSLKLFILQLIQKLFISSEHVRFELFRHKVDNTFDATLSSRLIAVVLRDLEAYVLPLIRAHGSRPSIESHVGLTLTWGLKMTQILTLLSDVKGWVNVAANLCTKKKDKVESKAQIGIQIMLDVLEQSVISAMQVRKKCVSSHFTDDLLKWRLLISSSLAFFHSVAHFEEHKNTQNKRIIPFMTEVEVLHRFHTSCRLIISNGSKLHIEEKILRLAKTLYDEV